MNTQAHTDTVNIMDYVHAFAALTVNADIEKTDKILAEFEEELGPELYAQFTEANS